MTWLLAGSPVPHWLTLVTVWSVLNACLGTVADALPKTGFWAGVSRGIHVWLAVSPLDVMKALKAVGGSLAVPPAAGAFLLAGMLALGGTTACASTQATSTPTVQIDPHQVAEATTQLLEAAWKTAATTCLTAANGLHDDTIRQKCEPVLTKARQSLLLAQSAVDTWTAADQKNFPCLVAGMLSGLEAFAALDPRLVIPQPVVDALTVANAYASQCSH